ncbi:MAG: type II secretion system protein N [Acidiferrobacter sp.]
MGDAYSTPMHMEQLHKNFSLTALGDRVLHTIAVPRVARLINVIAIVILAASLARGTWGVLMPAQRGAVAPVDRAPVVVPPVRVLLSRHLFGVAPPTLSGIPVTHLALTLSGVVAGDPGVALIGRAGHAVRPFLVGRTITAGVVLVAVTADRAILRQHGRLESLLLYPPTTAPSAAGSPVLGTRTGDARAVTPAAGVKPVTVAITQATFAQLAETAPGQIHHWLKPGPTGGLVVQSAPGSVFQALSLQAGDTIEAINGQPVNSLGTALAAYAAGARAGRITIDIARHGRRQSFQYTLP